MRGKLLGRLNDECVVKHGVGSVGVFWERECWKLYSGGGNHGKRTIPFSFA